VPVDRRRPVSAYEPPSEQDPAEEQFDVEALLALPEESGYYDCSVPEEFAVEPPTRAPAQPLDATCSREFDAIRRSGTRPLSSIRLIVIHCTQSDAARGSARWFTDPETQGSAHLVVDDRECYRTLDDTVIPWGAPGANTIGWHLELTGWKRWSRDEWLTHKQTLRRGAFKSAVHAKKFGIPIKLLSAADARLGRKGFVTHALCTDAFGGSHTDPGPNCPLGKFMQWTREFADGLEG
jgi:N-acetylmuramoyl-L-alanine amidase